MVLGVALGNVAINCRQRHPKADRPLIDFNTATVLEPLTLTGAIIGVFLNKLFPDWLLLATLVVILGLSGAKTLHKGWQTYKKERVPSAITERQTLLANPLNATKLMEMENSCACCDLLYDEPDTVEEILRKEKKNSQMECSFVNFYLDSYSTCSALYGR